ncbi:hypothetical protein [Undibacterium sp. RuTC16W]|uniref:hypothetical protein n=1 Tax=Undibacterium sp. RuTC16W TaxID=3413048 RepID=UPI003BF35E9B
MHTMTKFTLYSLIGSVAVLAFAVGLFAAKLSSHHHDSRTKIQASFDVTDSIKTDGKDKESKSVQRYRILT